MCCNETHYPRQTGIWRCDAEAKHVHLGSEVIGQHYCRDTFATYDHYHIVLPAHRFVCVTPYHSATIIGWHTGNNDPSVHEEGKGRPFPSVELYFPGNLDHRPLAERLALAVAEGATPSIAWGEAMAREWGDEVAPGAELKVKAQPSLNDALPVPPIPDYPMWLAEQVLGEARRKLSKEEGLLWLPTT